MEFFLLLFVSTLLEQTIIKPATTQQLSIFTAAENETILALHRKRDGQIILLTDKRILLNVSAEASKVRFQRSLVYEGGAQMFNFRLCELAVEGVTAANESMQFVLLCNDRGCVVYGFSIADESSATVERFDSGTSPISPLIDFRLSISEVIYTLQFSVDDGHANAFVFLSASPKLLQFGCSLQQEHKPERTCRILSRPDDLWQNVNASEMYPIYSFKHDAYLFTVQYFITSDNTGFDRDVLLTRTCTNDRSLQLTSRMELRLRCPIPAQTYQELADEVTFQGITSRAAYFRATGGNEALFVHFESPIVQPSAKKDDNRQIWLICEYKLASIMERFDQMIAECEREGLDVDYSPLSFLHVASGSTSSPPAAGNGSHTRCAELDAASRSAFGRCHVNHNARRAYLLGRAWPAYMKPLLLYNDKSGRFQYIVDFVVFDDHSAFLGAKNDWASTEYTVFKVFLAEDSAASFTNGFIWQHGTTLRHSPKMVSDELSGHSGELLAAAGDTLYATNLSSIIGFPLTCGLYGTCEDVQRSNASGEALHCVWCVHENGTGVAVSAEERGRPTQSCKQFEDCPAAESYAAQQRALAQQGTFGIQARILVGVAFCIAIIIAALSAAIFYRRWRQSKELTIRNIAKDVIKASAYKFVTLDSGEKLSVTRLPEFVPDDVRIPFKALKPGVFINEGNFGIQSRATLVQNGSPPVQMEVAVKILKIQTADVKSFLDEALMIKTFDHPRVMKLVGISLYKWLPLIVTPFMPNGDLRQFFLRTAKALNHLKIVDFGFQIADGMEYLHFKNVVHRDLAARNCMLDDEFKIRIGDFGLCRNVDQQGYYISEMHGQVDLPVRWMAPESISRGSYGFKTDIWAYGVLLWELASGCKAMPYEDLVEVNNPRNWVAVLYEMLQDGGRLQPPQQCLDALYETMVECWKLRASERPTFQELKESLSVIAANCAHQPTEQGEPETNEDLTGHTGIESGYAPWVSLETR